MKKFVSKIIALFSVLITCFGSFSLAGCTETGASFSVKDTLIDGQGKSAKVIILAGQSNASGTSYDEYLKKNVSAEKYAEYENGYDNVYINHFVSGNNQSDEFIKCGVRQGELGECFGPELGLAEKLHQTYPDQQFFIIKYAWGGTNLFEQWLSPTSKGKTGQLYLDFVGFVKTSMKYLISKNYDVKIEGMCWMQGESDSFWTDIATNYETNLSNFIKDIRQAFKRHTSADGMAFIDATIAANPIYWVYHDLVNQSKVNVEKMSPLNVLIDTNAEGLVCTGEPQPTPDVAHYDSLSEIKLGHLFAEKVANFF